MKSEHLKLVWKASGYLDAQLVKIYLESFDMNVYIFEESVGVSYGLTITPSGEVEIYVEKKDAENAESLLINYPEADGGN